MLSACQQPSADAWRCLPVHAMQQTISLQVPAIFSPAHGTITNAATQFLTSQQVHVNFRLQRQEGHYPCHCSCWSQQGK